MGSEELGSIFTSDVFKKVSKCFHNCFHIEVWTSVLTPNYTEEVLFSLRELESQNEDGSFHPFLLAKDLSMHFLVLNCIFFQASAKKAKDFSGVRCPGRAEPYSDEAIAFMRRQITTEVVVTEVLGGSKLYVQTVRDKTAALVQQQIASLNLVKHLLLVHSIQRKASFSKYPNIRTCIACFRQLFNKTML